MDGALIVPPVSLPPKVPMFRVPPEPACDAMLMLDAVTVPLFATVRVLLLP